MSAARRGAGPAVRALAAVLATLGVACAHRGEPDIAPLSSNSDQVIWEAGQKALSKHQWESARQHFRRIVDGFPQSEYAGAARLALGDSYFQEGGNANDILAVGAYREFLTLYPSHPKSDYAQYQVAEAYYAQRNGPDRDQTPTLNALTEYERLLELYPQSTYAEKARARRGECRNTLARAEFLAGYFYQHTRQLCRSAIPRYEGILVDYPDYRRLDEVLYRLAECLIESGRDAEAYPQLGKLIAEYPQSEYVESARELMSRNANKAPGDAETAPSPSPAPDAPKTPTSPPARPGSSAPSPLPTPSAGLEPKLK
jgi:outer membrane protein assembly factor BamD